ncbi:MAG: hypothetical protein H6697_09965 [Myxococcales bacterium]|nr:hypothetical protein [Myxococcales bacterium]
MDEKYSELRNAIIQLVLESSEWELAAAVRQLAVDLQAEKDAEYAAANASSQPPEAA